MSTKRYLELKKKKKGSTVEYKGALYRLAVEKKTRPTRVLYTLQVQPPRSKSKQEVQKLLFDLVGRSPDKTEEEYGSTEYMWGCESEEECTRHQHQIQRKLPGAIVDFHPAI